MKAWTVRDVGEPANVLQLEDKPDPDLISGHVLCKVNAVALGMPDVLMCRDNYPLRPEPPFTPGQEFAGVVTQVADDVTGFKPGDRVLGVSSFYTGHGALAETTLAMADNLYPVSADLDNVHAAAFTIGWHTAWIGLVVRAQLVAGETVLVLGGAGGTGSAAIQLASSLGAKVIAVAGGGEKVAQCRALGADEVIDHRQQDFVQAVKELTGGRGADIIYDPVGGESYEKAFHCAAHCGRVLPIGFASGRWGNTPMNLVVGKNLSVVGAMPTGFDRQQMLGWHDEMLSICAQGIKPLVGETGSFPDAPEKLQRIADRLSSGRIVLVND